VTAGASIGNPAPTANIATLTDLEPSQWLAN
jgi:hypothetical protein